VAVLKVYSANGDNTIDTLDALYNRTIGQRVQLSFLDSKLLNLAYCSGLPSDFLDIADTLIGTDKFEISNLL